MHTTSDNNNNNKIRHIRTFEQHQTPQYQYIYYYYYCYYYMPTAIYAAHHIQMRNSFFVNGMASGIQKQNMYLRLYSVHENRHSCKKYNNGDNSRKKLIPVGQIWCKANNLNINLYECYFQSERYIFTDMTVQYPRTPCLN